MAVLFNVSGLYDHKDKGCNGAFIREDGMTYFAEMVGTGWSGSLDLPDRFRTQRDVRSTGGALNVRMDGNHYSANRIRGSYRQEWCKARGEWTLEDLVNLGHISPADYNDIVTFYGQAVEDEAVAA